VGHFCVEINMKATNVVSVYVRADSKG